MLIHYVMLIHDAWVASQALTNCLHIGHLAAAGHEVDLLHSSQKQLATKERRSYDCTSLGCRLNTVGRLKSDQPPNIGSFYVNTTD